MEMMKYSIVIPVFKSAQNLPDLFTALTQLSVRLEQQLEVVFVVDGSPDNSAKILYDELPGFVFPTQIIELSRNFGSFQAIRVGVEESIGETVAVCSADLQEPLELIVTLFHTVESGKSDIALGTRRSRNDGWMNNFSSGLFWKIYRRFVMPDMPHGGVDVFACNQTFKFHLLSMKETRTSLIAQIFWLGFKREFIQYDRVKRSIGKSSWSRRKKIDYMLDSIFSFTDLPIRLVTLTGAVGSILSVVIGILIAVLRIMGYIAVPGYTPTLLAVLFLGAINLLAIGIIGSYIWRTFENSKGRPLSVIARRISKD
jgi:glycosyltransferase involved in cell wall biosynthesis